MHLNLKYTILLSQLRHSFQEAKRTLIGSFILTLALGYLMSLVGGISSFIIIAWILSQLVYLILRFKDIFELEKIKNPTPKIILKFNQSYHFLLLGTGVLWGICYFTLIYYGDDTFTLIAIVGVIGFTGTSSLSTGAKFSHFVTLNIIITLSSLTVFIFHDFPALIPFTFLYILALMFLYNAAYRYSQNFISSVTHLHKIKISNDDLIDILSRAGEYRDEDTGNHVTRMSQSAYLLCKEMGMSEDESLAMRSASRLHDLGKLGVPDRILLKPGKLTDPEMEIMKTHASIGHDILGKPNSNTIRLAKIIAISHHEKWDGSGYPEQLKGKNIPLEGRITALCDVFDALTSDRAYKKAWSQTEATNYIKENTGTHFDPKLSKLFIKIIPEITNHRHQMM